MSTCKTALPDRRRSACRGTQLERNSERRLGVEFSCTCIYHPHPATGRLEVAVHDPFCGLRSHRLTAFTKYEPDYTFQR